MIGVMKWFMQMPTWDTVRVLSRSQLAARRDTVIRGNDCEWVGVPLGQRPTGRQRSANWGLKDNTAWYGQEKKKLWVNMAVNLRLRLSPSTSLSLQKLWTLSRIKCESYIPITKYDGFFIPSSLIIFTNPSARAGYDTRSICKRGLTGLNSEFFLLLDQLPRQGWRNQSVLLFTHSWRENNRIHTFPKGISAMWNAISLVQDLNSCPRVHFQRR